MARLAFLAVALTVAAVGAAQAAPPVTDARFVVADNRAPDGSNGVFNDPKPVQPTEQRAVKPRIWISMGFGF